MAAVAVLMLTMFDDDDSVFAAMRAGARGYLLKGADQDEIVRAIPRSAAARRSSARVAPGSSTFSPRRARPVTEAFPELTEREREVLDLIAAGQSNADIAQARAQPQDRPQPRLQHLHQAAGRRPGAAIVRAREAGLGICTVVPLTAMHRSRG